MFGLYFLDKLTRERAPAKVISLMDAFRRSVHAGAVPIGGRKGCLRLAMETMTVPEAVENPKLKAKFREIDRPAHAPSS
jgi:hypothetical protein